MKNLQHIGFISDWHCGSRWGLAPPNYHSEFTGGRAKWLWDRWIEFWRWAPRFDLLCLMGDLIDGKQRRSEGTTLYTTSLKEQVDMARTCFRAIPARKRPKRIVRVSGTSYHESFDGPLEAFDLEFDVWQPTEPEQQYVLDVLLPNCPCWCLQQPYALNRRYYRWQPSIGGLTLTRLPKSLQHMHQGWVSHFETYQVPPLEQHRYAEIT